MLYIELDITTGSRLALSKALNLNPPSDGQLALEARASNLDALLLAARLHCLSNDEIYFLQTHDDLRQPLNHRNEAAAISLLLQRLATLALTLNPKTLNPNPKTLNNLQRLATLASELKTEEQLPSKKDPLVSDLQFALSVHCETLWPQFRDIDDQIKQEGELKAHNCLTPIEFQSPPDSSAAAFHNWAAAQGIQSSIRIASFDGLRGCAAADDTPAGSNLLSIPQRVLIYDDTVRDTDLGRMLMALPMDLSMDNLLIIFTMIDRFDEDSLWAPFWDSLPAAFFSGLSFPQSMVDILDGTAAGMEIRRGQAHLRLQYEATVPLLNILLEAYPQHLKKEWFEYPSYVWAAELWYSYSFEIEFPPNPKSKTVMVPFACHVNHSPWPHVVRYGRVNPVTHALDFPAFRPCKAGSQVFISYGPVPNLKLISYYGFCIDGNPHDHVPLILEAPDAVSNDTQFSGLLAKLGLSMEHSLRDGPLAKQLLACLRLIVATDDEMSLVSAEKLNPLEGPITVPGEIQALETLRIALHNLLEPVAMALQRIDNVMLRPLEDRFGGGSLDSLAKRNENGVDTDWHASLGFCRIYVEGQKRVLERSVLECEKLAGLVASISMAAQ